MLKLLGLPLHVLLAQPIPSAPWPAPESFQPQILFPDPFMTTDGQRVNSTAGWTAHRQSLLDLMEHYMMGTAPGRPAFLKGVKVNQTAPVGINGTAYARLTVFNITVGPSADCTNSFLLWLYLPTIKKSRYPVFVFNSDSENYYDLNASERAALTNRGYAIAEFDRVQLRKDDTLIVHTDTNSIQRCYSHEAWSWGTLAVWAWGGSRVIDFLVNGTGFDADLRSVLDLDSMMSIGHSRGGKTALWQAVRDLRVKIAFPLMSGEGGCGSFRVPMHTASPKPGPADKPEDIEAITKHFPSWFVPAFKKFARRESSVPFDGHFARALVAPRACMAMEGQTDWHGNPEGSQATYEATRVIYTWMGVPDRVGIHYHTGRYPYPHAPTGKNDHPMNLNDFAVVADFADYQLYGRTPENGTSEFEMMPFNLTVGTYRTWDAPAPGV